MTSAESPVPPPQPQARRRLDATGFTLAAGLTLLFAVLLLAIRWRMKPRLG